MIVIHLPELTEQTGEQGHEDNADQSDAATGHELLDPLRFCARVVVAVAFQKVDAAPNAETSSEGDNESLKNVNGRVKEIHK